MPLIPDWLQRRAELSPDTVALVDTTREGRERRIGYREWNLTANRTAHFLGAALGVGRGERVAVLAMNCTEQLDLLFACQKLGAILQPLNWRLGVPELAHLVADAAPRVLVYGPDFEPQVRALRERGVHVRHWVALGAGETGDLPFAARDAHPSLPPEPLDVEPEDPWVLCATGGSTGLPKQAVLTHGSITANAVNTVLSWGLCTGDAALLNAPLFHTGGLNVFTTPLAYAGGTVVVCRTFDAGQVLQWVGEGRVNLVFGVPTMFLELQRHPRFEHTDLSRLKVLISGGAPCPPPVFERFFARGVAFRTGYGLTEAGPNNFWLPASSVREAAGAVGVPLLHVEARLARTGEPGGAGAEEEGELQLRGPHLFAGYWNRPEETAAAFTEDGWLCTGDLARRGPDGFFRISGRKKDLIISGGENVYPAEVESVLAAHPAVAEVAVIGVPDERWGEVPRALVVLREDAQLDADALRHHCEGRLARYKWPRSLRVLSALPRTAAGKVDRRALVTAHGA